MMQVRSKGKVGMKSKIEKISLAEIQKLTVAERIQLVEDIWDTIADEPESLALTDAQKQELDRRLKAYHQNPEAGITWEELKAKIKRLA